ncbi:hypothetical protein B0H14DRAFT_3489302 [Mycena olivaceomarginata]|nr:hypothetical protein B0H14DRAFT_3489302 [Mycena olivaceomarginata]
MDIAHEPSYMRGSTPAPASSMLSRPGVLLPPPLHPVRRGVARTRRARSGGGGFSPCLWRGNDIATDEPLSPLYLWSGFLTLIPASASAALNGGVIIKPCRRVVHATGYASNDAVSRGSTPSQSRGCINNATPTLTLVG